MAHATMKRFWGAAVVCLLIFSALLAVRMGLFDTLRGRGNTTPGTAAVANHDTWMNVLQNGQKIGYSHSTLTKQTSGYRLDETLEMQLNIMGFGQQVNMTTQADLNPDMTLSTFDFSIYSGAFRFAATGMMKGRHTLAVDMTIGGEHRRQDIDIPTRPYLSSGIIYAAAKKKRLQAGDRFSFDIFDPATLGRAPVTIDVIGKETINNMGMPTRTTKLDIDFKGSRETAWVDDNGEIIKEVGIMGMTLERTSRDDALKSAGGALGPDMLNLASIPCNVAIDDPAALHRIEIRITGIDTADLDLNGGRQTLKGDRLTVTKEATADIGAIKRIPDPEAFADTLAPGPFVQSRDPKITSLVRTLVSPNATLLANARKIYEWVHKNIQKMPVISVPDALSTLENRMGDCNENAVLVAAMARAAGIPAQIESGLVYLRGRFYYHAWDRLYVGKWITVDATFGQFPADVTHLRLVSGTMANQLDLVPVIGRIKLTVLGMD